MSRHRILRTLVLVSCAFALFASAGASHAGLGDALKKRLNDKATKKAEEAVDKATDKTEKTAPGEAAEGQRNGSGATTAGADGAGGASGKVSAVSTKFDYVPGDSVLFIDDFKQDELGEFPSRWSLVIGTFEVAEMEGERWLRCVAADGTIRMKLPVMAKLPEFWTLEFDFYATEPMGSALTVRGVGDAGRTCWEVWYPSNMDMAFRSGAIFGSAPLEGVSTPGGRHHIMFMARGTALKAYIDRQRLVNVPDISAAAGMPSLFEIRLWASTKPMITNVRFAEGCRPAKDMLDQGKLVTYGIRFQTASDVVLPESAPVLRQVAAYMEAHADVKLKITGHTDNVGTAASNLDLSKRRAASVAKVLSEQFAITADRFTTDGKGDTQAVSSNVKAEGRAMNRRVEFAKL
jgi:outer membrane protein OmpA-like peptidoglycan-associated protein